MNTLDVRLLGRPVVFIDGEAAAPPKGAKAWALLAYLAGSDRPHPRAELAELLFCEAGDPLGALRWNLAALRRLLGRPDELKGDPVTLGVPDAMIDVRRLEASDADPLELLGLGQELLSGLGFVGCPVFELWLAGERHRLRRRAASLLREAALRCQARGDHALAIRLASELTLTEPLDEGHHALLIRAHTLNGDAAGARLHFEQCRALLRSELGVEPGSAVLAAIHLAAPVTVPSGPVDRQEIEARMVVAWQTFLSGAVDHAIDLGRGAVAVSDRGDDMQLRITTRLFLAAMLSIAVRGWDESATAATEALHLTEGIDLPFEEATARGILGGIDLMRADYRSARQHTSTGATRCDEPATLAMNLTFLAAVEADVGELTQAVAHTSRAIALAESTDDPIRISYAHAYAGHALLLMGDPAAARPHVERAMEASASMSVFNPWPTAMLAEIEVSEGRLDAALGLAGRAAAVAAATDVAYQRALAMRATALVASARGDDRSAIEHLIEALGQARRTTGEGYSFHWPVAWILESLAVIAARSDPIESTRWATALLDHATTVGMVTFERRAQALLALSA